MDRDIDRTAPVYGQQAYNRYPRTISPPVIYNGLHHPHEPARYVPRQEVYIYPSGPTDRRGHDGGGDACQCTTPAAGRDRAGYLTWPGKTEFRSN